MGYTKVNKKVYYFDCTGWNRTGTGPQVSIVPAYHHTVSTNDQVSFGSSVGNWKYNIRHLTSATTSMTGSKYIVRPRYGSVYQKSNLNTDSFIQGPVIDQSMISPITVSGALSSEADSQARSQLLSKYIKIKSTWRGGNFLAEIAETIEMFKHPVRSFYHETYKFAGTVKGLGKVYKKNPASYSKRLSDAWLAYVFGVKPTVSDANDLADTLNGMANRQFIDTRPISGFGRSTTQVSSVGTAAMTLSSGLTGHQQSFVDKTDLNVKYYGVVTCNLRNANQFLVEQFGMSAFDVLPAVWEAIPWSFFVDYFTNVGEMIDSIRYANASFAWLNRTYRNARTVNASPLFARSGGYAPWEVILKGGGGYKLAVQVNRIGIPYAPYPDWTFRVPGLSSMKWLNIAALLAQIRGSRPA